MASRNPFLLLTAICSCVIWHIKAVPVVTQVLHWLSSKTIIIIAKFLLQSLSTVQTKLYFHYLTKRLIRLQCLYDHFVFLEDGTWKDNKIGMHDDHT